MVLRICHLGRWHIGFIFGGGGEFKLLVAKCFSQDKKIDKLKKLEKETNEKSFN